MTRAHYWPLVVRCLDAAELLSDARRQPPEGARYLRAAARRLDDAAEALGVATSDLTADDIVDPEAP